VSSIVLPSYATNYGLLPLTTEAEAQELGFTFSHKSKTDYEYVVYWGTKPYTAQYGDRYGVMETGFFHNASFIDTVGNYQTISLNTAAGYKAVADFDLEDKKSARELIQSLPAHQQSKYNATYNESEIASWTGPVLILQNPTDRSILSVTSTKKYLEFVRDCCKFYGDKLFVKFHPWNSGEIYAELEAIVKQYGCKYGKARLSIIDNAEFCVSFNSTFAVDALLKGVPYVQYAPGTFYNAYGIIYSKEEFVTNVQPIEDAHRLCDFLIHKFCFKKDMDRQKFANMIRHYAKSKELFPMTDEYSYAANIAVVEVKQ